MPHLKELVERHKDQPFTVLGVNTRDAPDAYRKGVEKFGVTWISAYQGVETSPISDLYRVEGYPTYYLLDAEGRVVESGHSGTAFDEQIAKLLDGMKQR
jgi:hypothetical protein